MMKKLLMLLAFFVGLPVAQAIQQESEPVFWFCFQVGMVEEQNAFLITDIFISEDSYEKNIKRFGKVTKGKKSWWFGDRWINEVEFNPAFEASCISDVNLDDAAKQHKKLVAQAIKRNFVLFQINLLRVEAK